MCFGSDKHTAQEKAAEAVSSRIAAETGQEHEPYSSQRKAKGHIQSDEMAGVEMHPPLNPVPHLLLHLLR